MGLNLLKKSNILNINKKHNDEISYSQFMNNFSTCKYSLLIINYIAQLSIENSRILENFNPKPLVDCEDEEYFAEESR
jgi:hypothetical protein